MPYDSATLSAALKTSLQGNVASMQAAIAAGGSGTMLQDFCDTLAGAIVAHLTAHPVVIPPGVVLVGAAAGVPNPAPIPLIVT